MRLVEGYLKDCFQVLFWTSVLLWTTNFVWAEESGFIEESQVLEIFIYQDAKAESRVMVVHPNQARLSYPLTWGVPGRNLSATELDRVISAEISGLGGTPQLTVTIKEEGSKKGSAYLGQQIQRFSFYGMGDVARLIAEVLKSSTLDKK